MNFFKKLFRRAEKISSEEYERLRAAMRDPDGRMLMHDEVEAMNNRFTEDPYEYAVRYRCDGQVIEKRVLSSGKAEYVKYKE